MRNPQTNHRASPFLSALGSALLPPLILSYISPPIAEGSNTFMVVITLISKAISSSLPHPPSSSSPSPSLSSPHPSAPDFIQDGTVLPRWSSRRDTTHQTGSRPWGFGHGAPFEPPPVPRRQVGMQHLSPVQYPRWYVRIDWSA